MKTRGAQFLALSQSADPAVRGLVASDPRCPEEVLLTLLADDDESVSDLAFLNPSLPPEVRFKGWEHVVKQGDFESAEGAQLWRVMFTPIAPVDLMEHILSQDFDELEPAEKRVLKLHFFAWNLLEEPHCPTPAVRRAILDGPPRMRNWAARNPTLTADLVDTLIDEGSNMFQLALNPAASHRVSEIVPWLTTWELLDIPMFVKNNASEAVILSTQRLSQWLVRNPEPDRDRPYSDDEVAPIVVVRVLAEYSSCPDEITRLCCHENAYVRHLASQNPIATSEDQVMVALLTGT